MSYIAKTEAIALRIVPFSETSVVITWLTPEYGRIATVLKGAMRSKSRFLGQFDLFYKAELLFYLRSWKNIHIAREVCFLKRRDGLRRNWRAGACASYLCDLLFRNSLENARVPEIFEMLDQALDQLETARCLDSVLFSFELKYASCLGLKPQLESCIECNRSTDGRQVRFSPRRGAVTCAVCDRNNYPDSRYMPPDILALMKSFLVSAWRSAANTKCTRNQSSHVANILGLFLAYHMDFNGVSRTIAFECIRYRNRAGFLSDSPIRRKSGPERIVLQKNT